MADKQAHSVLIASVVSLCDRATIDLAGGVDAALRTIVAISLKYLDRKVLLESVIPG
jgi:hypothetical protein